jgi:serine/threonine protein kinase
MLSEKLDGSFENKLKWFRQFLKGLSIIHSRDRAHFDIKLDNLFLVGNRLKIGDFEFYYKIEDFKKSDLLIGTAGHIAPEMFVDREHISTKVDIFSAGVAFAQLFTGKSADDVKKETAKDTTGHEEEEGLKKIFLKNHRIYEFFKALVENRLALSTLPLKEKSVFRLLQTNFLKGICILTWGILFLIVASAVLAKISLLQIPFFVKALKYLSWIFWGLICFSLPFLIYYQG